MTDSSKYLKEKTVMAYMGNGLGNFKYFLISDNDLVISETRHIYLY